MRIALVHDWLTGMRGGERVVDVIARNYPDAELFTLFHQPGSTTAAIENLEIHASPLNRFPGSERHYRKLLPLYPWAANRLRVENFDLVLSISHAVAKNVRTEIGIPHLCYCLTPMRYIWDQIDAYLGRGARRMLAAPLVTALRRYDVAHSGPEHIDRFVAISSTVSERIQNHYGRNSTIIHPPVDTERIRPDGRAPDDFFLLVGGFVPYKREEIVIEAFRRRHDRLVIVGDGPTRQRLEARAPANVEFTGRITDAEILQRLQRCRALIYPQVEDFGITAVEAQAAGRPVIAHGAGGSLDTVRPLFSASEDGSLAWLEEGSPSGAYFNGQNPEALGVALDAFAKYAHRFEVSCIRENAERFGEARFVAELAAEIDALVGRR